MVYLDGRKSRHEFYITLVEGEFSQGRKTAAKNIQVRVSLCSNGEKIDKSIIKGRGAMAAATCEYSSTVLYHSNTPKWDEVLSIVIPSEIEELEKCYLMFELFHCSSSNEFKPFGISYLSLIDPKSLAVIHDDDHYLKVFESGNYSPYQCLEDPLPNSIAGFLTTQTFIVRTQLRSTRVSQDWDIHCLLNWRHYLRTNEPIVAKVSEKKEDKSGFFSSLLSSTPVFVAHVSRSFSSLGFSQFAQIMINISHKPNNQIPNLLPKIFDSLFAMLESSVTEVHNMCFFLLSSLLADLGSGHACIESTRVFDYFVKNLHIAKQVHVRLLEYF